MQRTLARETPQKIGETVTIKGWVAVRRDHGKLIFIDARDRSGTVQVVFTPQTGSAYEKAQEIRPEWVVEITGTVQKRPKGMETEGQTGAVEIAAQELAVLSEANTMPFPIDTAGYDIDEETRLKYRYLDLRRPRLQKNLALRSEYVRSAREFLFGRGFTEIETPLLTKSTPEGSRDFVVPSRVYPGKFYALPQSPQQYKQLLMVAGVERYFQIARCLRDEDPRADRVFEHTQIDIEMSFASQEEVMETVESMVAHAAEKIGATIAKKPFPIFTYKEAMEQFHADKFDLRNEQEKKENILKFAWVVQFPFFEKDKEGNWTFTHNPFSAPLTEEHEQWLLEGKNIGEIVTSQYDLVCNGLEVGGGSIRAHRPEVLKATLRVLGYNDEAIEQQFGHMLEALSYGAPPHGGCAHGFERLLMAYLGEEYIREVQAFPQTGKGRTSVMDAPSELDEKQLAELQLSVQKKK
ncbi:MAG: aspartate--tRNA ligase [Candidatus Wildermuthbacteria bacterium]|nr:aspartate--tRNA ligase [Candidatus Wildermuthbacteria bacterium]